MQRSRASVAVGAIVLLIATGCTPTPEPVVIPDVVWQDGAPSGAVEDDPAVQVVRASMLAEAAAVNAHDFTLPTLLDSSSLGVIEAYYVNLTSTGAEAFYGPRPGVVTEVEVSGDETVVHVCGTSRGWRWSSSPDGPEYDPADAVESTYTVGEVDGVLRVITYDASEVPCDGTGAALGLFDPAPATPDRSVDVEIRLPEGVTAR